MITNVFLLRKRSVLLESLGNLVSMERFVSRQHVKVVAKEENVEMGKFAGEIQKSARMQPVPVTP